MPEWPWHRVVVPGVVVSRRVVQGLSGADGRGGPCGGAAVPGGGAASGRGGTGVSRPVRVGRTTARAGSREGQCMVKPPLTAITWPVR